MQRISQSMVAAVAAGVMLIAGIGIAAQEAKQSKKPAATPSKHVMVAADEMKWGPGPAALPEGVQVAVLDGNPDRSGRFTLRAKMPDGYVVPPHSHPTDEHLTIISGTLMVGLGGKIDEAAMRTMNTGAYGKMPARTNHYVRAEGETILQLSAMGPFEVNYVNPADDPRKKTAARK